MPRKRRKPEEIVAKLRQVDVAVVQGVPLAEAIRGIGVSEVACHRWRDEYGGFTLAAAAHDLVRLRKLLAA